MGKRSFSRLMAAIVAAVFIPASVANAARLDAISTKEERLVNGERVKSSAKVGQAGEKATGNSNIGFNSVIEAAPLPDALEPDEFLHLFMAEHDYRIDPEAGEVEGQCVLVDWTYEVSSSLEVTGLAGGEIAVGGYAVSGDTEPPSIVLGGPSEITLSPAAGSVSTEFSHGPQTVGPSDPDIFVERSGGFVARIGDDVLVRVSAGSAAYVPPGDTLSSSMNLAISATVRDGVVNCDNLPVEVTVGDVTQVEGDSGISAFSFPVSVSSNVTGFTVTAQTADGTATAGEDYTAVGPIVLTFEQGGATTQDLIVEVSGDLSIEADETFSVELSDTSAGAVVSDPSGLGTILNDDGFKADVTGTKEVDGGMFPGGIVIYTIRLENSGPGLQQDNSGDEFVDVLPAELDLLSATADSGSATADTGSNTVRWNGEIPAGGTVNLTIEAALNESAFFDQPIFNHGSINYDADGLGSNDASRLTDDPGTATSGDATVFHVHLPPGRRIPALNRTALAILALMMALAGLVAVRR